MVEEYDLDSLEMEVPTQSSLGRRIRFKIAAIWRGPAYPQDLPPRPVQSLLAVERLPDKLRERVSKPVLGLSLFVYVTVWMLLWMSILYPYLTSVPHSDLKVVLLTCGSLDLFWKGKNAKCGLNAEGCPQLKTGEDYIIRCPALCDRGSWTYSLLPVGDQLIKYRGYFIGGGKTKSDQALTNPYRGDSYPCGAAVHAGLVSPFWGGCARVTFDGPQQSFEATPGKYGVSDSVAFSTFFPQSFSFKRLTSKVSQCHDPRLIVLVMNILLGIPVVFFASPASFFWITSTVGFWTIALATDPPVDVDPNRPETTGELISVSFGRFLPTLFVLFFFWKTCVKSTFVTYPKLYDETTPEPTPETEPIEPIRVEAEPSYSPLTRLFLWYPFFWLGVLNNITFDRLPVDRLTWGDLQQQPGALLTVLIVGLIVAGCAVAQAYYVWLLGKFWHYLKYYLMIIGLLVWLLLIPGLTLRIHHYIFGLVLLPGCFTKGRTAYLFQGILLGLFLSGVSRWGYASIVETNVSLLRGEPQGKVTSPHIRAFDSGSLYWTTNATWTFQETVEKYTDVSLLINDVERFRGENVGLVNITEVIGSNLQLQKMVKEAEKAGVATLYLRLARYSPLLHKYGDYSRAAVLHLPTNDFIEAPPGFT